MKEALERYMNHLRNSHDETGGFNTKLALAYTESPKYIKITTISGPHTYIVKQDHSLTDPLGNVKQFYKGDILAAMDHFTPQLNITRGNILTNDYGKIIWTIPELKERPAKIHR